MGVFLFYVIEFRGCVRGSGCFLYTTSGLYSKCVSGCGFESVWKWRFTSEIAMVSFVECGLTEVRKSQKAKMKGCGAAITSLRGLRGGFIEGERF